MRVRAGQIAPGPDGFQKVLAREVDPHRITGGRGASGSSALPSPDIRC
jgi:hypothetical protein